MTLDPKEDPTYLGCTLTGEVATYHWEDSWGEMPHPEYSRWNWRQEVAGGDTQLGYWEWCQAQQEEDAYQQHLNA